MTQLPGAVVVIDVRRENNALLEAQKLGIPTICLIDTDSDPQLADLPIPGNDDAIRAIEIVVQELCGAIAEGKTARAQQQLQRKEGDAGEGDRPRRRSTRAQFRAVGAEAEEAGTEETATEDASAETTAAAPTAGQ